MADYGWLRICKTQYGYINYAILIVDTGGPVGNSFVTIITPSGTSPVADDPNDSLTLTSTGGSIIIIGNAGTDTINFDVNGNVLTQPSTGSIYLNGYEPPSITGVANISISRGSLPSVAGGQYNVAMGWALLTNIDEGDNNVAIGSTILNQATTADNNVAIGSSILTFATDSNTTTNVALGLGIASGALADRISSMVMIGSYNCSNTHDSTQTLVLGVGNLISDTDSATNYETIIGTNIGPVGVTYNGTQNILIGDQIFAGAFSDVSCSGNIAIGPLAMYSNNVGSNGIAIGARAMYSNTEATANIAIGSDALHNNTTNFGHLAIGAEAAYATDGATSSQQANMAIGNKSLHECITGEGNLAVGYQAGFFTLGSDNLAIGTSAMLGSFAAGACTGSSNLAIGSGSLLALTTGNGNSAIGSASLSALTTGATNISVGNSSGLNITTGNNNISIGYNQYIASATASNQLNIGNFIYGTGLSGTTTTLSNALIGFGIIAPVARVHITNQTLGNEVFRLESIATNDDPAESVFQNRLTTTDATQTTIHTFTVPASTTYTIEANVVARRTGGSAGTAEDGAYYQFTGTYKNVAGTATIIGAIAATVTQESQAGFDATFTLAGATVLCKVTGATNNNIVWHMTARVWKVGT